MKVNQFALFGIRYNISLIVLCLVTLNTAQGIAIEDRYWTYQGKKVLLIGGWNHGHNPFIDHSTIDGGVYEDTSSENEIIAALDELAEVGGNLIRCVLDPGVAAGRQGFDFCARSEGLYDLNRMTGPFWTRLDMFLREARKREIVVGIEIWDRFDWYNGGHEGWPRSPFNPKYNINYTVASSGLATSYPGKGDNTNNPFGQTTPNQSVYKKAPQKGKAQFDLVRGFQQKFMDKLLAVTFAYDNVLYSANNEVRHQEPAWGEYWIAYIKKAAAAQGKTVLCTDMFWNLLDLPGPCDFDHLLANADIYDYFDISQISAQRNTSSETLREVGQKHWRMVIHAAQKAKEVDRLLHMNKIYGSVDRAGGWMGSAENAVEEFWRGLIAGVAGARFHRPESGLGLSEKSKNCIRAVRLVEDKVKFWEVEARQDLLTDMDQDEAYLAAQPGQKYILFFTDGGSIGLQLNAYEKVSFELTWINIDTGQLGASTDLTGGRTVVIQAPGKGHWVAAIVKQNLGTVLIDDRFDDGDPTTNSRGTGSGWYIGPMKNRSHIKEANSAARVGIFNEHGSVRIQAKEDNDFNFWNEQGATVSWTIDNTIIQTPHKYRCPYAFHWDLGIVSAEADHKTFNHFRSRNKRAGFYLWAGFNDNPKRMTFQVKASNKDNPPGEDDDVKGRVIMVPRTEFDVAYPVTFTAKLNKKGWTVFTNQANIPTYSGNWTTDLDDAPITDEFAQGAFVSIMGRNSGIDDNKGDFAENSSELKQVVVRVYE